MRRPRTFSHKPIYIDERRERLAEIEQRVRQELGMDTPADGLTEKKQGLLHGRHERQARRKTIIGTLSSQKLLLLIVLLFLIWKLLL